TERGVDVRTGTTVEDARDDGDGLDVTVRGPDGAETLRTDRALVAVGRSPRTDGLDLHRTRVEVGPDGFVRVDRQQRTTDRRVFAIGDVAGEPMLAHKASHEGRVAAEVAAGRRAAFDARAIPAVVFTDPAIAWCGLTEIDAEARGADVRVARFPWSASGRAVTLDRTEGVTRVILDPETRRVLGVGLVGVDAGELIAEAALAIEMGATADDLARTIHPHPTLSETLAEAAEQALGGSPHRAPPARADS
ncbi:MAG: NAD(P)/FAD-dependent oxidoreductase, partial [Myxococcales bacterium]|nr:NAD(P)/FAD-dependent oxidoreductase [Myxococcales bacterium]